MVTFQSASPERACWWLGVNNVRRAEHPTGHVKYPAVRAFLDGENSNFEWPFDGSSSGSSRYYRRMTAGDRVVFWMGDGVYSEWGIIGFGSIRAVNHAAGVCTLEHGSRAPSPITPYSSGRPSRTEQAGFLRDLFGPSFRPLRKLYVRLGYMGVKPCVVTVDEVSPAQFAALAHRAGAIAPAVGSGFPEEVVAAESLVEGAVVRVTVNGYERNPEARRQCIAAYQPRCYACGFDFGAVYGPEFAGFIHVHHLRPLSEVGREYVVDPIEDLRPVCPNCHAVLHCRVPAYSIEDVRGFLARQRLAEQATAADGGGM